MSVWSDDRVETLKKMWADGSPVSTIAERLGCFSGYPDGGCGAVTGKAHALNLPRRRSKNKSAAGASPKPSAMRPKVQAHRPSPTQYGRQYPTTEVTLGSVEEIFVPLKRRKTLLELDKKTCRFPYGDPGQKDFFFCGGHPRECSPYCEAHTRIAYQPTGQGRGGNAATT